MILNQLIFFEVIILKTYYINKKKASFPTLVRLHKKVFHSNYYFSKTSYLNGSTFLIASYEEKPFSFFIIYKSTKSDNYEYVREMLHQLINLIIRNNLVSNETSLKIPHSFKTIRKCF